MLNITRLLRNLRPAVDRNGDNIPWRGRSPHLSGSAGPPVVTSVTYNVHRLRAAVISRLERCADIGHSNTPIIDISSLDANSYDPTYIIFHSRNRPTQFCGIFSCTNSHFMLIWQKIFHDNCLSSVQSLYTHSHSLSVMNEIYLEPKKYPQHVRVCMRVLYSSAT